MTIFVSLPLEILENNLTDFWDHLHTRLKEDYPGAVIRSNYTGESTIKDSDLTLFIYEFKDEKSCKEDIQKCKQLGKPYKFYTRFYSPNKFYFPR